MPHDEQQVALVSFAEVEADHVLAAPEVLSFLDGESLGFWNTSW